MTSPSVPTAEEFAKAREAAAEAAIERLSKEAASGEQIEGWVVRDKAGVAFAVEHIALNAESGLWEGGDDEFILLHQNAFPSVKPGQKVRAVLRLAGVSPPESEKP